MENIARYIIRALFSVERLNYIRDDSKVIFKPKNGNDIKPLPKTVWNTYRFT